MTKTHNPTRFLSALLALAVILGLFSPMTLTAHATDTSNLPSNVKVHYSNAVDYRGNYYSENLGGRVDVRTIRTSYNYGGDTVNSYALCMEKGDGLSSRDTYTYEKKLENYPAAPFITFMMSGVRVHEWDDATVQSVQGWVNAVVWLTEAGLFTDPLDQDQIHMAAEERLASLKTVFPGNHTLQSSIDLLNMIVAGYNNGDYGNWDFYQYNTSDAGNQNLLIAEQSIIIEDYFAYVQLDKENEAGEGLSGASFTVYENGVARGKITTDASGHGVSERIPLTSETATLTVVETTTPSGYASSGRTYTVKVDTAINDTAETAARVNGGNAITNTPIVIPTEYVILKTDKATGEPLSGATFRLKHTTSNRVYDLTTNEDGVIELQWLLASRDNYIAPGTYTVTEISPPTGYTLSGATVETLTFEKVWNTTTEQWEQNDPGQLKYENPKDNTIRFTKIDEDGDIINGGSFNVYRDGTLLGNYKGGSITLSDLKTGYYTFHEIAPPAGYVASANPYASVYVDVKDTATDTYYLSLINYEYPDIQIRKSSPTGLGLSGAIFDVKIDGASIGQVVTNSVGVATISYDQYGAFLSNKNDSWTITATEIKAPTGYLLSEKSTVTAEIQKGQPLATLEFVNDPIPEVEILKIDSATGKPLAGATFEAYIDGESIGSFVSDKDGLVSLDYSDYGKHFSTADTSWVIKVVETAAPAGYDLSDVTEKEVTVTRGQTTVPFVFGNYKYPSIEIYKSDEDTNRPLAGSLFKVSLDTQVLGYFTTGSDGKVVISYADYYEYLGVTTDNTWTVAVEEVRAPSGYLLNENNVQTAVLNRNQGLLTFAFGNYEAPTIQIEKLDSSNGNAPIAGAVFEVRIDTASLGSFVTDKDGLITITYEQYGHILDQHQTKWTVTATELSAPDGYLPDAIITLSNEMILGQKLCSFTFTNSAYPAIIVEKRSSTTNELLEGATFDVTIDGTHIGSWTTDKSGKFTITHAQYGDFIGNDSNDGWTVVVTETTPPDGYHDAVKPTQQAQMFRGQSLTPFVFVNVPRSDLIITKVDSVDQKPLAGVTFEVKRDTTSIGTFKTDKNGEILIIDLELGTYTVTEVKTIAGYVLNDTPQTVEVRMDDNIFTYKLDFENDRQPTLTINKVDSITGDPIHGAKFEVTHKVTKTDGERKLGTFYTDENGVFSLPTLDEGWYTVTEIEPAAGYSLKEPLVQEIHLSGNENGKLTFENTPLSALIIKKVDATNGEVLQGAKFQLRYFSGVSGTGGTVIGNYETSTNGTIVITGLKAGTYIVEETKAPDGYVIDDAPETVYISGKEQSAITVEFENQPDSGLLITKLDSTTNKPLSGAIFEVRTDDGTVVGNSNGQYTTDKTGTIHLPNLPTDTYVITEVKAPDGYTLDGAPQTVKLIHGETHKLTFYNEPAGGLMIVKVDAEDGDRIAGVKLEVRQKNGAIIGTYTTDRYGVIRLPQLDDGWYTVTELEAPKGYMLDSTPHNIEVTNGKIAKLTVENTVGSAIMIHKVDSVTGKGIYGVQFLVSDSRNNPIGMYTSDQNGYVFTDKELKDGKYYVREIKAADGYLLDTTVRTFYVRYGSTSSIKWENTPVMGQIQITKTSATDNATNGLPAGTRLPDATFAIYNRAGRLVDTIVSGWNGVAVSKTIPLGRYTIREIKAPTHYKPLTESIEVELEFSGQIVRLEVENESVTTQVSVDKIGYSLVLPGQFMEYRFQNIANQSNVPLGNFYWRDTLPTDGVRLEKIITGTWNQPQTYKVMYKTNLHDYRMMADNLSTQRSYTLDASPTALHLASNEYITEYTFQFGTVQAGFVQVQAPWILCKVNHWIHGGYAFTNKTDVGGVWNGGWVMATDRWVTTVFGLPTITLPKTGY